MKHIVRRGAPSFLFLSASLAWAAGPIPNPIVQGSVHVELKPVATGLTSPVDMVQAPDDPNRQYVVDQAGQIRTIQNGTLQSQPFLDLSGRLVTLSPGYDERGLLGLAFDPGFNTSTSPGFHKFYTFTSEPLAGAATFTVPMPVGTAFNHQSVLAQWSLGAGGAVDPTSRRELIRIDKPQFNHNGGTITFGPDNYLYMALGDGGNANDIGAGHNPTIGNAQDLTVALGKMLRIDVHGTNSANGQYGVPQSNPFVGTANVLPEIYAYGLRNPYRFSFDRGNGQLILADVGQNNVEEIDRITSGGNFGWHLKEGTFKFNPADGTVSSDLTGLPPGLIDPLAQYDHDEGIAAVGGFVYRGTMLPQLQGKYIFGDLSRGFAAATGRLFYADLATGQINELVLDPGNLPLNRFVKGFGEDASGELYVLVSDKIGPSGTTGAVYAIVPEPAGVGVLALGAIGLLRRRRS